VPTPIDNVIDPGANLGWWSQLEQQQAAKGKPADDDEDDAPDDDEEDDDEEDEDADKSEDELRAELKKVRASLKGSNDQAGRRRGKVRELQRQLDELRNAPKPKASRKKDDEDDDDLDVESIREQAKREGQKAGDDRVKRAEVRTALARAGVSDEKALGRLSRMVELDDLHLGRAAAALGDLLGGALDPGVDVLLHAGVEGADGALHVDQIGDDVLAVAAMDLADGDDGRLLGHLHLAALDGLQPQRLQAVEVTHEGGQAQA